MQKSPGTSSIARSCEDLGFLCKKCRGRITEKGGVPFRVQEQKKQTHLFLAAFLVGCLADWLARCLACRLQLALLGENSDGGFYVHLLTGMCSLGVRLWAQLAE